MGNKPVVVFELMENVDNTIKQVLSTSCYVSERLLYKRPRAVSIYLEYSFTSQSDVHTL